MPLAPLHLQQSVPVPGGALGLGLAYLQLSRVPGCRIVVWIHLLLLLLLSQRACWSLVVLVSLSYPVVSVVGWLW